MLSTHGAHLLMRHTTPSLLARLDGDDDDVFASGVGLTKRVRHLEELGSCHSPRPAPRLWRRSRFAILTATWAGERQRAVASRRTARKAEDEARMHLRPPLMVLTDGSHETHLKLAGAAVSSTTHTHHSTVFEASHMYRLSKGAVDRFPLSNPAAKVGHGPAPGGTHTPDGCLSAKPVGMIRLREIRGAYDPMIAAPRSSRNVSGLRDILRATEVLTTSG
ncbi:uncharacterized protein BXZ73DRAFT_81437 [Epithele typhae]|uniref:uncharacterized protein n=1 Tax=Epithele typhae TaxID=378194 RepID=UPI002008216F|nr:uncharacterized protein BXZ73DRAFT_81437 [Epithele typhae]KAH9915177.1 hypothetical protein BXZ73DRAFT_81437 [Epithele typhae]